MLLRPKKIASTLPLLVVLLLGACSSPPAATVTAELGRFTGFVDASRGLFAVRAGNHDEVSMEQYALTQLDIDKDGSAGSGAADTVELVTLSTGQNEAGCVRDLSFCGSVRLRSFFDDEIRGAHVEINSMFPATGNEGFGDNPDAFGHSGIFGLWSYGNLSAQGQADRTWKFNETSGTRFTFNGFVVGQVEPTTNGTETNCTDPFDNDGDGDQNCADPDCAHDPACAGGEVCGNGIDDDGDSDVDCSDTDCSGDTGVCPVPLSCSDLLSVVPTAVDGIYEIDPDGTGGSDAFSVYCDMTTAGGGWTLVAYAANANLGSRINSASASYDPALRTGSQHIDASNLVGISTEFSFAWTTAGGFPTGNIGSYNAALHGDLPADQNLALNPRTPGQQCSNTNHWRSTNTTCDVGVCGNIPAAPGGGAMYTPRRIQDGCYGNAYAFVQTNGNTQCDWTIDAQAFRTVYMRHGANANCQGVVQSPGGSPNLLTPSTLSMWMR